MAMKIDNIVKDAISGVQTGLSEARKASGQLAMATGGGKDQPSETQDSSKVTDTSKVVKASDADLGNFVDVEA